MSWWTIYSFGHKKIHWRLFLPYEADKQLFNRIGCVTTSTFFICFRWFAISNEKTIFFPFALFCSQKPWTLLPLHLFDQCAHCNLSFSKLIPREKNNRIKMSDEMTNLKQICFKNFGSEIMSGSKNCSWS